MNNNDQAAFSARLSFIIGFFVILFLALIFRLYQKQILQYSYYQVLAKQQYTTTKELPPSRGKIYVKDSYDTNKYFPVALNEPSYQLLIVPKSVKNPKTSAEQIGPIINMDIDEIYNKINNSKPYIPPIAKKLTKEQAKKIEDLSLEGILLIPEEWRYYPENRMLSHVLGYVDWEGKGQYGIEDYWNDDLSGTAGSLVGEKSSGGEVVAQYSSIDPQDGSDLYLTIDRVVQYIISEKLKEAVKKYAADSGTVIVADPKTGAILGMASYPDFNPNKYSSTKQIERFNNPSTASVYEPGSVFKVVAMAAGIDSGKVKPDTRGFFGRCVEVGIEKICTSTGRAYGNETMTNVLENSDNVGMVWMAGEMPDKTFYQYIRDFGFGTNSNIDTSGEVKGELMPLSMWRSINKATISFGQGIAVTPVQMVQALSVIANKGKLMQPFLVEKQKKSGEEKITTPKLVRQVVSQETASKIKQMMISVVDNGFGKKAQIPGYAIAGKTGTAEVAKDGGYDPKKNIISFGGFAPAEKPKFTMLVKLDHPKGAPWSSEVAAPVWKEIAEELLKYFRIAPTR